MDGNLLENLERKSCVTPRPRPGASVTMVSGSKVNSISTGSADVLVVSSTALKMEIFVKCLKVKWQTNWKHLGLKWLPHFVDHCYNRRSKNGNFRWTRSLPRNDKIRPDCTRKFILNLAHQNVIISQDS